MAVGLPLLLQNGGAATGASAAVGLLDWSFLWLVRGTEGSLAGLILIFVPSTFTLIIDDGPKLRVDLTVLLLGVLFKNSSQPFLKLASGPSSAAATETPHSGPTDEHGPVH